MTAPANKRPIQREAYIDAIRALCMIYIVGFWHLMDYTQVIPTRYYKNTVTLLITDIVLGLFVFVSGYLIGRKRLAWNASGIWSFLSKRIVRIYPLYAIALLLFGLLGLCSPAVLGKAAVLVSSFAGPQPLTLWFITMIMVFYLLAPLLLFARRSVISFSLTTAGTLAVLCLAFWMLPLMDYRLPLFFPAFAAGIYFAGRGLDMSRGQLLVLVLIVLLSVALSLFPIPIWPSPQLIRIPLVISGALATMWVTRKVYAWRPRELKVLATISYAGYGMYLFHRPIFAVMVNGYLPTHPVWQLLYLVAVCVPVIIAVSLAAQATYDRVVVHLSANSL